MASSSKTSSIDEMWRIETYGNPHDFIVRIDREVTASDYIFRIDLPGQTKKDLTATVNSGRYVNIYWRSEDGANIFNFVIRMAANSDLDKINVAMIDGVITVTAPKAKWPLQDPYLGYKKIEISG
ncbi:hypothetical protein M569_06834 [Genlisea aurea]|uniref:SHSP domain-containing protein n=1 Tax=Genlisea aurea TaxID=192259 RepID=S8CSS3_9LAMI|nr:hypothetical protein M569_06834 [Genlisea aurea]